MSNRGGPVLFLSSCLVLGVACGGGGDDDDDDTGPDAGTPQQVDPSKAQILADAPPMPMELALAGGTAAAFANPGEPSSAACLAWASRKSAKQRSAEARYLACVLAKAADAGVAGPPTEGANAYAMTWTNALGQQRAGNLLIYEDAGAVKIMNCGGTEENPVPIILITVEPDAGGGARVEVLEDFTVFDGQQSRLTLDTTTAGVEAYTYAIYHGFVDHPDCDGPSGLTPGATDTVCFFRSEGTLVNYDSGPIEASLTGYRAMKEMIEGPGGETNAYGSSSHASVFLATAGASRYDSALNVLDPDTTGALESWGIGDLRATTTDALEAEVPGTLAARTAGATTITESGCEPGQFFEPLDVSAIPGADECVFDPIQGADAADCDEGNVNLGDTILAFLCDEGDPLTDATGLTCP